MIHRRIHARTIPPKGSNQRNYPNLQKINSTKTKKVVAGHPTEGYSTSIMQSIARPKAISSAPRGGADTLHDVTDVGSLWGESWSLNEAVGVGCDGSVTNQLRFAQQFSTTNVLTYQV